MIQLKEKQLGKLEQLRKATKAKETQQVDSRTRFRQKFSNLEKKTNLQTKLILNYIHPTPFHLAYIAQSKRINQRVTFPCESLFLQ